MADVVLPHNLQNGPTHPNDATQVMANFNAILAVLNGGLDLDNMAGLLAYGTDVLPALAADDDVQHKDVEHGLASTPRWAGAVISDADGWALIRTLNLGPATFRVEARAVAAGVYPAVLTFRWLAFA